MELDDSSNQEWLFDALRERAEHLGTASVLEEEPSGSSEKGRNLAVHAVSLILTPQDAEEKEKVNKLGGADRACSIPARVIQADESLLRKCTTVTTREAETSSDETESIGTNKIENGIPVAQTESRADSNVNDEESGHRTAKRITSSNGDRPEDVPHAGCPDSAPGPGAYAHNPGRTFRRRPNLDDDAAMMDISHVSRDFAQGDARSLPIMENPFDGSVINNPPDEELAMARPVDEDEDSGPIAVAKEDQPSPPKKVDSSKQRTFVMFVLVLIAAAVVLVLVLVTNARRKEEADSLSIGTTSGRPTDSSSIDWVLDLPNYTKNAIMEDPDSSQAQAYKWIQEDPYLDGYTTVRKLQRFALATFYYSTSGAKWENNKDWLSYESHECDWRNSVALLAHYARVSLLAKDAKACTPEGGFRGLVLVNNGLVGKIPPELGLLTSLEALVVGNNKLAGFLPSQLWELSKLNVLAVNENLLFGELEPELLQAVQQNMLWFDFSENDLYGTIPTEIGLLGSVAFLGISDNSISGSIPSEVGLLTKMEHIALSANQLSGSIPSDLFGNLGKLTHLELRDNAMLSGSIPSEIGLASNLMELYLYYCDLSGTLPSELHLLPNLTHVVVAYNRLTGKLPEGLWKRTGLIDLDVFGTDISGTVPTEIGLMSQLIRLSNAQSKMWGSIPSEIGRLTHMERLYLNGIGTIPPEVWALPDLTDLVFSGNLTGPIEVNSRALNQPLLNYFDVASSQLTGTIPNHLCALESLEFECTGLVCGCDCPCD